MTRQRARLSLPLALTLLAIAPAAADAAQRYAATTGTNNPTCSQVTPCDIETAVNAATSGDEVIVAAGTYTLGTSGSINVQAGVDAHGAAGPARPLITGSNISGLVSVTGHASDLRIEQTSTGANTTAVTVTGVAERFEVTSTSIHACYVQAGGVLRDSFCIQSSPNNGSALFSGSAAVSSLAKARNVTAISTGGNSYGARMTTGLGGSGTLNLRNVIASGTLGDVRADTQGAGETSTVEVAYSNYDLPSTGGLGTQNVVPAGTTNQSSAPIFVNAGAGDYREAFGSPTINAGAADADVGSLDVDGEPRQQGASIDIGADEFTEAVVPPPDTTAPETTIAKGPKKKTKSKNATFTFSSSEPGSTFVCKLDRKAFGPCTSPAKYKRLKKGKHTFTVVATDSAGNADASAASYRWKVKRKRKK